MLLNLTVTDLPLIERVRVTFDRLRATLLAAANGQAIARLVDGLHARIGGEGSGARDLLARTARDGTELARLDPRFGPLAERLTGLSAELDDAAVDLARQAAESEPDPTTIAVAEERSGRLYALSDAHLQIRKRIEGARTTTQVRPLEGEERVGELAAMLGGAPGDAAARAAARELLARAGSARGEFSSAA